MSQQLSCCDMYKVVAWFRYYFSFKSNLYSYKILIMSSWILCEMVPRLSGRSSEARSYEPRKPISEAELWANYHGILSINSTPPNDEIVCKWCGSTVIQMMAFFFYLWQHQAITRTNNDLSMSGYYKNQLRLINIKPLQEPIIRTHLHTFQWECSGH